MEKYSNKSLISVLRNNTDFQKVYSELKIKDISCRHNSKYSEFIIDTDDINKLLDKNIHYKIIHRDLEKQIKRDRNTKNPRNIKHWTEWYHDYKNLEHILNRMNLLVAEFSDIEKIELNDTNIKIEGIKVGFGDEKPLVFINGCQHAREWITPMANMYLLEYILRNKDTILIKSILNSVEIHIFPVINEEGYKYSWEKDRYWRKNRQSNNGSKCIGTDLNRNWDKDWGGSQSTSKNKCSDIYIGEKVFSAPETELIKEHLIEYKNRLVGHLDIHSYSALVLGSWAYTETPHSNHQEIVDLGNKITKAITDENNYEFTFGTGSAKGLIYLTSGTMPDWTDSYFPNCVSYTLELRPNASDNEGFHLNENKILKACHETYKGVLEMLKWAPGKYHSITKKFIKKKPLTIKKGWSLTSTNLISLDFSNTVNILSKIKNNSNIIMIKDQKGNVYYSNSNIDNLKDFDPDELYHILSKDTFSIDLEGIPNRYNNNLNKGWNYISCHSNKINVVSDEVIFYECKENGNYQKINKGSLKSGKGYLVYSEDVKKLVWL